MSPRWLDVDALPWEALSGVLMKVAPTPSGRPTPQAYAEELRVLLVELAIEHAAARPAPSAAAINEAIEWLDDRLQEGKGAFTFGATENGDVGLFFADEPQDAGSGDTVVAALLDACARWKKRDFGATEEAP